MERLVDELECNGCEVCKDSCPFNAIDIMKNKDGFIIPVINESLCKHCGVCERMCSARHSPEYRTVEYADTKAFGGYLLDEEKLKKSASGGFFQALAKYFLDAGGIVYGVVFSDDYKSVYYTSSDELPIEKMYGSKYVGAEKRNVYRKVKLSLDSGRKTLFTGLPCEVAALYGFLGRQYDNLTTCELICAGPSSYLLYEAQKDWIHEKYGSNVKTFSFRYKKYGWVPYSLQAVMQNSHEYSKMFEETLFGVGMKYAKRVACYNCKYKGEKRLGDFTIGDFWEIDRKSQCYNEMGTSVVFARTGKALELIQRISSFRSYEVNAEYAAKGNKQQLSYAVDVPAQREEFMNMLKTERPDIVFRSFKPQKTLVKSIKNKLPAPIYRLLRKYIGF